MEFENSIFPRELFENTDMRYLKQWAEESGILEHIGFYRKALSTLLAGAHDDEDALRKKRIIHVDMGVGFGQFLYLISKSFSPQSLLIGIENNPYMFQACSQLISKGAINVLCWGSEHYDFNHGADFAEMKYAATNDDSRRHFIENQLDNSVNLVKGDIRDLSFLTTLMGGQKIDSGSLLVPGSSPRLCFEKPYKISNFPSEENEQRSRMIRILAMVRTAAYEYFSEHVREDGRIVLRERGSKLLEGIDPIGQIVNGFRNRMGQLQKFWDFENNVCVNRIDSFDKTELGPDWHIGEFSNGGKDLKHKKVKPGDSASLFLISVERNSVEYAK